MPTLPKLAVLPVQVFLMVRILIYLDLLLRSLIVLSRPPIKLKISNSLVFEHDCRTECRHSETFELKIGGAQLYLVRDSEINGSDSDTLTKNGWVSNFNALHMAKNLDP